jgi:uncharacterized protein YcbK (DUF882 family)
LRYPTVRTSIGLRVLLAIGAVIVSVAASSWGEAEAREGNRTIKLYFGHTGERGEFTFKRNGRYDRAELNKINRFLRDWRRNEPAKMDPQLLDLIWSIYKETGSHEYINVVSAYRSLATNNMLRKRSRGVAAKSQHTNGKAMDFYIPGVPLAKLRGIAMKHQGGGVGYYPTSGSPFVHVDTGSVRSWPRMSRQQLLALFPNGETLYLPADGKPLAGYERALAKKKSGGTTALAYLETGSDEIESGKSSGGNANVASWLKRVFTDGDEDEDAEAVATKPVKKPEEPAEPATQEPSPAAGDPTILLAAEPDPDMRMPRARPAPPATMLADLAPTDSLGVMAAEAAALPSGAAQLPAEHQVASLSFAPLPRRRPDAGLLAASLETTAAESALDVPGRDAIAALEAIPGDAPPPKTAEPAQVALAPSTDELSPIDPADRAILAGFAAIEDVDASPSAALEEVVATLRDGSVPAPRARPVTLAFAGAGLRSAAEEQVALVESPPAPPPAPAAEPTPTRVPTEAVAGDADSAALGKMIAAAAPSKPAAQTLKPKPASAPGLFSVPETADSLTAAQGWEAPPTGHFERPEPIAPQAKESFFTRLFASLTE